MSTFSKDHATASCSSSMAASALHHLRKDEEEGGVRDMCNAKVDIFSRLFVGLGLCLVFRIKAKQILDIEEVAMHIHDIEEGAIQPSTERQTSNDAHENSALTDERTFGCEMNASTPWRYMPLVMLAVIILSGLLNLFL